MTKPQKVTVVAQHVATIDSGRELHPGESAQVDESPRHQLLIAEGRLKVLVPTSPRAIEPEKEN